VFLILKKKRNCCIVPCETEGGARTIKKLERKSKVRKTKMKDNNMYKQMGGIRA